MRIIFASNNKHKLEEVKMILQKYKNIIFSTKELGVDIDPKETGQTFEENAKIKAGAAYNALKQKNILKNDDIIIADDTGLCIDFFHGAPGLYSARFMGYDTPQIEKNKKIIEEMKNVPFENRKAKFYCNICMIKKPLEKPFQLKCFEGIFDGSISNNIIGDEGFGYDPIFIPEGETKSVALLGEVYKSKNSHRAKALQKAEKEF